MAPNKRSTHAFKNEWNGKRGKIQKSRWERGKGRIQRQRVQVPRVRRRRVAGCRFTEVEQVILCCLTSYNFFSKLQPLANVKWEPTQRQTKIEAFCALTMSQIEWWMRKKDNYDYRYDNQPSCMIR